MAAAAGPSEATIKAQIEHYYGGADANKVFQFQSIRVAKPRVMHIKEAPGIAGGTTVWPVLAKFTIFKRTGDVNDPSSVCSTDQVSQFWYFWRNEFGDWGDGPYANSENAEHQSHPYSPCSTMPGVQIFQSGGGG